MPRTSTAEECSRSSARYRGAAFAQKPHADTPLRTYYVIFAWLMGLLLVTVIVSLVTTPRRDSELRGLVYSLTERPHDEELPWFRRPAALGAIVLAVTVALNVVFF